MPSVVPDHIRAAILAGHVGWVGIFCDQCGFTHEADYTGETREIRFAAARANLAQNHGWSVTPEADLCHECAVGVVPDDL